MYPNSGGYGGYGGYPQYQAPVGSGSMVEPSNPRFRNAWAAQQPRKKSKLWLILLLVGIVILIVVAVVAIALQANQPPVDEQLTTLDDGDEDDLNAYYASITSDPDYVPDFDTPNSRYTTPPDKLTCDKLTEVKKMDTDILNLYLNSGAVVAIKAKGSKPFTRSGNTILIYGGSLINNIYHTIPFDCPDVDLSASSTTYTGSNIFSNIDSDRHFYVWSGPEGLNTSGE